MSDEQVGKYIRLLCYQHQNGHSTEAEMISLCKGRDELVFSKFLKDENGLYYNEEMENEILRRSDVSKSKTLNTSKRWDQEKNKEQRTKEQLTEKINTRIPEYDD